MACKAAKEKIGCVKEATGENRVKTATNESEIHLIPATTRCSSNTNVGQSNVWLHSSSTSSRSRSGSSSVFRCSSWRPLQLWLLVVMALAASTSPSPSAAAAIEAGVSAEGATGAASSSSLAQRLHSVQQHGSQRRTRLRKRHSNYLYFHDNSHEGAAHLEWQNPCGGVYEPQAQSGDGDQHFLRPPVRHYLKQLRRTVGFEYRTLNGTLNAIDISDMGTWQLHRYRYKFLPRLKQNSSIALKRWYRNMQTFVAAFAFLGRTQYSWDRSRLMHASKTSHELNELLISARRLLCEIETAINGSYPHSNEQKLTTIGREAMDRRLRFRTKERHHNGPTEADLIDVKFAKDAYYRYLLGMWKTLRRVGRRRGGQVSLNWQDVSEQSSSAAQEDSPDFSLGSIMRAEDGGQSANESSETSVSNAKQPRRKRYRSRRTH